MKLTAKEAKAWKALTDTLRESWGAFQEACEAEGPEGELAALGAFKEAGEEVLKFADDQVATFDAFLDNKSDTWNEGSAGQALAALIVVLCLAVHGCATTLPTAPVAPLPTAPCSGDVGVPNRIVWLHGNEYLCETVADGTRWTWVLTLPRCGYLATPCGWSP